jgi:hypothetical protein
MRLILLLYTCEDIYALRTYIVIVLGHTYIYTCPRNICVPSYTTISLIYYYIGATGALRHGRHAPHLPYAGTRVLI